MMNALRVICNRGFTSVTMLCAAFLLRHLGQHMREVEHLAFAMRCFTHLDRVGVRDEIFLHLLLFDCSAVSAEHDVMLWCV